MNESKENVKEKAKEKKDEYRDWMNQKKEEFNLEDQQ
jgi:hypothetical protein